MVIHTFPKDSTSYCLMAKDEVYGVFLHQNTKTTSIDLGYSGKTFEIKWYDPKNGGDLQEGTVTFVKADGVVELGFSPKNKEKDWVILIK